MGECVLSADLSGMVVECEANDWMEKALHRHLKGSSGRENVKPKHGAPRPPLPLPPLSSAEETLERSRLVKVASSHHRRPPRSARSTPPHRRLAPLVARTPKQRARLTSSHRFRKQFLIVRRRSARVGHCSKEESRHPCRARAVIALRDDTAFRDSAPSTTLSPSLPHRQERARQDTPTAADTAPRKRVDTGAIAGQGARWGREESRRRLLGAVAYHRRHGATEYVSDPAMEERRAARTCPRAGRDLRA